MMCVLLAGSLRAQEQQPSHSEKVAFVLDIGALDEWYLEGGPAEKLEKLVRGQSLPAHGIIAALRSSCPEKCSITIAFLSGKEPHTYGCSPAACDKIVLPGAIVTESSTPAAIMRAVAKIFAQDPGRVVPMLAREGNATSALQEGIVQLSQGQLDLSPVFEHMTPGSYLLRFSLLTDDTRASGPQSFGPLKYAWRPESPSPLPLANARPGLYRLSLLDVRNREPSGVQAWILVAGPQQYAQARTAFQEAVDLTKQWHTALEPRVIRGFLRAYLEALAGVSQ